MAGLCPGNNIEHLHVTTTSWSSYASGTRGRSLRFHSGLGLVPTLVAVFATLVLGTACLVSSATAEESLDGKAAIEAKLDAKAGKVNITVRGKGDGVYVNKEFGIKCSLKIKDGGKLEKAELKKEDAKYEDAPGKTGKAKSVSFTVGADKQIEGECKVVACSDSSCSSPFKVSFASN
jgi:hypothetical protein